MLGSSGTARHTPPMVPLVFGIVFVALLYQISCVVLHGYRQKQGGMLANFFNPIYTQKQGEMLDNF